MKKGFTLVELVTVLVILSLLTHLAVRELSAVRRNAAAKSTVVCMDNIRDAVWKTVREGDAVGFVTDMGRLPIARTVTNRDGRVTLALSELWRKPDDIPEFSLRPAAASALRVAESVKGELADTTIRIPCGWRGPYVRLPFGKDRLLDSWGNPFETPDDAGYARLVGTNGTEVLAGEMVYGVRSFGSDARPDDLVTPADASDHDYVVSFVNDGGMRNQLVVDVQFRNATGPVGVTADSVRCRWYMPCSGAITGGVEKVALAGSSFASFTFDALPPGVCTLAVDVAGVKRAQERVMIVPGGTVATMKVYMP